MHAWKFVWLINSSKFNNHFLGYKSFYVSKAYKIALIVGAVAQKQGSKNWPMKAHSLWEFNEAKFIVNGGHLSTSPEMQIVTSKWAHQEFYPFPTCPHKASYIVLSGKRRMYFASVPVWRKGG